MFGALQVRFNLLQDLNLGLRYARVVAFGIQGSQLPFLPGWRGRDCTFLSGRMRQTKPAFKSGSLDRAREHRNPKYSMTCSHQVTVTSTRLRKPSCILQLKASSLPASCCTRA